MSSFFKKGRSDKKRRRVESAPTPVKRRKTTEKTESKPRISRSDRDESISSGSDDEQVTNRLSDDEPLEEEYSGNDDETAAERRLRLAENYLENLKGEVREEVGFDAEQIDKDLLAERLQEDVAETKGVVYRNIASALDLSHASKAQLRSPTLTVTGVAVCAPFTYTVSKDMVVCKWKLPVPPSQSKRISKRPPKPVRRRPIKIATVRGDKAKAGDASYMHHTGPILCVATSTTGKFIATGGADKRLIVYSQDLVPLKVFMQHRDSVTAVAFRRGTDQLYSASKERTVKVWSLDELAYVETLFGLVQQILHQLFANVNRHQDEIVDVASLNLERVASVGARDRTARLWKVVDETQLVFRGGGTSEKKKYHRHPQGAIPPSEAKSYGEGSIDRIVMIDEETFCTGSDNGSLSLWNVQKKKPIWTIAVAHGLEPALSPEQASAEAFPDENVPNPQPRWITALTGIPFSDLIISGSWDGQIRVWKVSRDRKRLEAIGCVGVPKGHDHTGFDAEGPEKHITVQGIINDLACFERGDRGQETLCIVASHGTEHRLGRWKSMQGKNGAVVFELPRLLKDESRVAEKSVNGLDFKSGMTTS